MDFSSIFAGALSKALGTVKSPTPTDLVPNPLHQYASYTYNWSLWWLDVADYNAIASDNPDVGTGTNIALGPNSYVVAEQGGVYAHTRMPETLGLDYNIKTVEFETVVGLNSTSKSSNMTRGSMVIIEPFGVTLIDSLILHSINQGNARNYTNQPYMLQLDFVGYDDSGTAIPVTQTNIYRKRFPIGISEVGVSVSNKGTEYKIEFYALGQAPHTNEHNTVPKDLNINASTVGEFFAQFSASLNEFWQLEASNKKVQYADSIVFDIDPSIASASIIYGAHMNVSQANPNGDNYDVTKGSFAIKIGSQIKDVVDKVIIQSDFVINQLNTTMQQSLVSGNIPADQAETFATNFSSSMTKVLNTYKITTQTRFAGVDASGTLADGQFDNIRNQYSKRFTYSIHQYSNYDVKHPAGPTLTDSTPYTVKEYNYLYTGKNVDVIDLKINFDKTFYTAVNTYTDQFAAVTPTKSTALDNAAAVGKTSILGSWFTSLLGLGPDLSQVPTLMPLRYKSIVTDQRDTMGFNIINNPAAQTSANLMRSLYTNLGGDMLNLDLTIVGDPTLLKQDDWLYSPSPNASSIFNSSTSQSNLASQYGQIRMDNSALVARVNINTPIDIDTDYTNNGLVYPQIGTRKSFFSGQYQIRSIKNEFSDGKFTQVLSMTRCANSDYAAATASATSNNSSGRDSSTTAVAPVGAIATGQASGTSTAAGDTPNLRPTQADDPRRLDQ